MDSEFSGTYKTSLSVCLLPRGSTNMTDPASCADTRFPSSPLMVSKLSNSFQAVFEGRDVRIWRRIDYPFILVKWRCRDMMYRWSILSNICFPVVCDILLIFWLFRIAGAFLSESLNPLWVGPHLFVVIFDGMSRLFAVFAAIFAVAWVGFGVSWVIMFRIWFTGLNQLDFLFLLLFLWPFLLRSSVFDTRACLTNRPVGLLFHCGPSARSDDPYIMHKPITPGYSRWCRHWAERHCLGAFRRSRHASQGQSGRCKRLFHVRKAKAIGIFLSTWFPQPMQGQLSITHATSNPQTSLMDDLWLFSIRPRLMLNLH